MSIPQGRIPSPDPKYPFVGEAYQRQGGEVKGYVYDPYTDKYYIDPEAYKQQQIAQGLRKPDENPSVFDQYAPVIGGVAAASAAKALGQKIPGYLSSAGKQLSGLFGVGSKAGGATAGLAGSGASAAGTGLAQTAAANTAFNAGATAAGGGLSGVGGAGATAVKGAATGASGATGSGVAGALGSTAGLAGVAAAGLAGAYNYGGRGVLSGDGDKADYLNLALQSNPLTFWVNPALDAIGLGSVGEAFGLDRKKHSDYTKESWKKAYDNAATDQDKAFANQQLDFFLGLDDSDGVYKDGPLAGRKWKWDEVKNALDGSHFVGEVGFAQTIPDWKSGYSDEQRREIANAALDYDLLSHSKEGRTFKDENAKKIQEIANAVRDGSYQPLKTQEQREKERTDFLASLNGGEPAEKLAEQTPDVAVSAINQLQQNTAPVTAIPENINTRPMTINDPAAIDPGFNLPPDHPKYKEIMELINQTRS